MCVLVERRRARRVAQAGDERVGGAGVRLHDGAGAEAELEPARRDRAVDAHRLAVARQPDEVEREAHRERVHGAAAREVERELLGHRVEPGQALHPRRAGAGLGDPEAAGQVAARQVVEPRAGRARLSRCRTRSHRRRRLHRRRLHRHSGRGSRAGSFGAGRSELGRPARPAPGRRDGRRRGARQRGGVRPYAPRRAARARRAAARALRSVAGLLGDPGRCAGRGRPA